MSTWSSVSSGWEQVKQKMHPWLFDFCRLLLLSTIKPSTQCLTFFMKSFFSQLTSLSPDSSSSDIALYKRSVYLVFSLVEDLWQKKETNCVLFLNCGALAQVRCPFLLSTFQTFRDVLPQGIPVDFRCPSKVPRKQCCGRRRTFHPHDYQR